MKIQMKMIWEKKLNDTVDEVKSSKEEDQDKDSMMEYRHFILN